MDPKQKLFSDLLVRLFKLGFCSRYPGSSLINNSNGVQKATQALQTAREPISLNNNPGSISNAQLESYIDEKVLNLKP